MKRFEEIKSSKFERMNPTEMGSVKGGSICVSCKKRGRVVEIEVGKSLEQLIIISINPTSTKNVV